MWDSQMQLGACLVFLALLLPPDTRILNTYKAGSDRIFGGAIAFARPHQEEDGCGERDIAFGAAEQL